MKAFWLLNKKSKSGLHRKKMPGVRSLHAIKSKLNFLAECSKNVAKISAVFFLRIVYFSFDISETRL